MSPDLLTTKELPGWIGTWTLTTRISEMFELAENNFGKKDNDYFFLGIAFKEGVPHIQYILPLDVSTNKPKYVLIHLSPFVLENEIAAYFQLSQEVYHLLSLTGDNQANMLEEGLSYYFSKIYMMSIGYTEAVWESNARPSNHYYDAYMLVDRLLNIDAEIIKKMRTANRGLKTSHFTIQHFEEIMGPDTPHDLINELLQPF